MARTLWALLFIGSAAAGAGKEPMLDLPDADLVRAYERAAGQNVLAAVNPKVFPGYWSVCADGQGYGYGNTYPSLDGHQMTDALLWLGQAETAKANWAYVRSFQRPNGQLPLAILPGLAGKSIANNTPVDPNGGLYRHWVPGDPLRALAGPTYIQNADVIFRFTQDRDWLLAQLPSINLAADHLATLVTADGAVGGAGYYIERPTRVEYDGVAQCHAADAFQRAAELNRVAGKPALRQAQGAVSLPNGDAVKRYEELARRIAAHFRARFWAKDRFAEYIHPTRGPVTSHGLTDTDWSAIALGLASPEQTAILWPQLKDEKRFDYGGMPAGIATRPETYEAWEFTHPDRQDLAAMGRVWYLECAARARMADAESAPPGRKPSSASETRTPAADGLVASIRKVCREGEKHGYYWRERYGPQGGYGVEKYCEYPANLIRIVQRFLLGVEHRLDGALVLAPRVPEAFWDAGFGQTLSWRGRTLAYRMQRDRVTGEYRGEGEQRLCVRLHAKPGAGPPQAEIGGRIVPAAMEDDFVVITLPAVAGNLSCRLQVRRKEGGQ